MNDVKDCSTCNISKPLTDFHVAAKTKDGRRSRCKSCRVLESLNDREKHREKRIATTAAWARRNPERTKEGHLAWREKNKDKIKQYWTTSIANGTHRDIQIRRRAKIAGAAINDFTKADWADLLARYDSRCAYCGEKGHRLERDHIVPLAAGGDHTKSNIVPACRLCNAKKGSKLPTEVGMVYADYS